MNPLYFLITLILQKSIWIQVRLMMKFFVRLRVEGLDNLRGVKGNAIFASNHISELDPILVPASLPFFSRFSPQFYVTLVRSEYYNSGWRQRFYGGLLFKLWGGYPAYLGLKDYEKSLVHHSALVKKGRNLTVFPEGQITENGLTHKAKGGVAYLSLTTGRPIVPVAISGVYAMDNDEFFGRKRVAIVRFGKPVYPENLQGSSYTEKAECIMNQIQKMLSTENPT